MTYYWLDKHVQQWQLAIAHDHKPQAVIVSGVAGIGKSELLMQILAGLVCRSNSTEVCGKCQNCKLYQSGYHPDIYTVEPEKSIIKVKMIRELTEFFTSTPHCSDYKIAVIHCAESMNVAAANALLKVLEEPPSRGILFLVTASKHQLMPTIRSRCISLNVELLSAEKKLLTDWVNNQQSSGAQVSIDESTIKDVLTLCDHQPKSVLTMLADNKMHDIEQHLDGLYAAFNQDFSVSGVAKQLVDNQSNSDWVYIHRYFLQLLKSTLNRSQHEIFAKHPLNQLIKKSPKVIHIIIKIAELVQRIMLNLNTQIKDQLLLESMLVEIKSELNHGS